MIKLKVLLKRHWRTPKGRYGKSIDGVPTLIPVALIKSGKDERGKTVEYSGRFPLPSDAVIVGDDYKTPEEVAMEESLTDYDTDRTGAEIEAEINKRVNEELDRREKEAAAKRDADADVKQPGDEDDDENNQTTDPAPDETGEGEEEQTTDPAPDEGGGEDDQTDADADAKVLASSVPDVVAVLGDFNEARLRSLLASEQAGKERQTLIVEIEAAIEDCQG